MAQARVRHREQQADRSRGLRPDLPRHRSLGGVAGGAGGLSRSIDLEPEPRHVPVRFRFDQDPHRYIDLDTGQRIPHITGMLEAAGLVDDLWFTEESSERGTAVHRLTATYDLEGLDVDRLISPHRGYLLAHVRVMQILRPEILAVEEPAVHGALRFAGRPDREVRLTGAIVVWEIKSGAPAKSHPIQTALQAILIAPKYSLPPELIGRYAVYLTPAGKFKVLQHVDRGDFDKAREVIRKYAR
jgi:hypothetical protein